jgi:hypothetical protein
MTLPTIFATLSNATGAELDANFAALGAIAPIPGAVTGTNALVLTPAVNTPSITSLTGGQLFVGTIVAANTGSATLAVGSLSALTIYKDTTAGPVLLTGGEMAAGNIGIWVYDASLSSGAGGFHFASVPPSVAKSGSASSGQIAQWTGANTVAGLATTGTGNAVLATGPTITGAAITATTLQTTTAYTVATLPAAVAGLRGSRAYVTDASLSTASVGAALAGGGANVMPVFCNGAAWVYG